MGIARSEARSADLRNCVARALEPFRSVRAIAKATGLDRETVVRVRTGRWKELARSTLLRLLVLDPSLRHFTHLPFFHCPGCKHRERTTWGEIERTDARPLGPHLFERWCQRCQRKRTLPKAQRALVHQELGAEGARVFDRRDRSTKARAAYRDAQRKVLKRLRARANPKKIAQARARFRDYVKQPRRSASHRAALGKVRVVKGHDLRYDFHRCPGPGCGRLRYRTQWHPKCWRRWVSVFAKRHRRPPSSHEWPALLSRGRPVRNLKRDYRWLIKHRAGHGLHELARAAGVSPSVVTEAIDALMRRLPGRWGLVFSNTAKKGNVARQQLMPLPDELQYFCQRGERDGAVRRLHDDGWSADDISELTGVELPLVRAIIAWHRREGASSPGTEQAAPAAPKPLRPAPRRGQAEGFLAEFLDGGVRPAQEIRPEARARGIKQDTLRAAKTRLGVRAFRLAISGRPGGGRWFWAAPGLHGRRARRMARTYKAAAA